MPLAQVMISGTTPSAVEPNQSPTRPKPADHLVGDQHDPVAIADLAHALEVAGRRHDRPAAVLHRLHNDRRDRLGPFELDQPLDLVGAGSAGSWLASAQ